MKRRPSWAPFRSILPAGLAFCPSPGPLPLVSVAKVVDGDTLRLVDGRSVRLIGINTPELGRDGRKAEPFAVAAQRRLRALVEASNGRVGLVPGRESKDRYGRTLAPMTSRAVIWNRPCWPRALA